MTGGPPPPAKLLAWALLIGCLWSRASAQSLNAKNCIAHDDCPDYAQCDDDMCACEDGFSMNGQLTECQSKTPCDTGLSCDGKCAQLNGVDRCYCPRGELLDKLSETECIRSCPQGEGFDYVSSTCVACQGSAIAETSSSDLHCVYPDGEETNEVDVSLEVEFGINNCIHANGVTATGIRTILLVAQFNKDFKGICVPEDFCLNIVVDAERHESNNTIKCQPAPSCHGLPDANCHDYRVKYQIDFYSVLDKIHFESGDKIRPVDQVILELLYLMRNFIGADLKRTLVQTHSRFILPSAKILNSPAENHAVYLSLVLDIPFNETLLEESSLARQDILSQMFWNAYGLFIFALGKEGFLYPAFQRLSIYPREEDNLLMFNGSLVFSKEIDDDVINRVATVVVSSHKRLGGSFGVSGFSLEEKAFIYRSLADAAAGNSALNWCSFFDNSGLPICGIEELCAPNGPSWECNERSCPVNKGLNLITQECIPCEAPATSSAEELFCFYEPDESVTISDVTLKIEAEVNNCDIFANLTALAYSYSATYTVRQLFQYKEDDYLLKGLCRSDDCENIVAEVEGEDDDKVVCRPEPSCTKPEEDCARYRLNVTIKAWGVPDKIQVLSSSEKKRHVVDAIIESLYLMIDHVDDDTRQGIIWLQSRYVLKTAEIDVEEQEEHRLYVTIILKAPFHPNFNDPSSDEYTGLVESMGANAQGVFTYALPNHLFLYPEFIGLSEYVHEDGNFIMFNASLVFGKEIDEEMIFRVASVCLYSHEFVGGTFGDTEITIMEQVYLYRSLEDAMAGISALDWCEFFAFIRFPICQFGECQMEGAGLECSERTCPMNEGLNLAAMECHQCLPPASSSAEELFCYYNASEESSLIDLSIHANGSINSCDSLAGLHEYNIQATHLVRQLLLYSEDDYIMKGICNSDSCDNVIVKAAEGKPGKVLCTPAPSCRESSDHCNEYNLMFTLEASGVQDKVQVLSTTEKTRNVVDAFSEALFFMVAHGPEDIRPSLALLQTRYLLNTANVETKPAEEADSVTLYITVNVDLSNNLDLDAIVKTIDDTMHQYIPGATMDIDISGLLPGVPELPGTSRFNTSVTMRNVTLLARDPVDALAYFLISVNSDYGGSFLDSRYSLKGPVYIYEAKEDIEFRKSALMWCKFLDENDFEDCGDDECLDTDLFHKCDVGMECDIGSYYDGTNCVPCGNGQTTFSKGAVASSQCTSKCLTNQGITFSNTNPPQCKTCTSPQTSTAEEQFCYYPTSQDTEPIDIAVELDATIASCLYIIPNAQDPHLDPDREATEYVRKILNSAYRGFCERDSCRNVFIMLRRDAQGNFICTPNCGNVPDSQCQEFALSYTLTACNIQNKVVSLLGGEKQRDAKESLLQTLFFLRHPANVYEKDPGVPQTIFPPNSVDITNVDYAGRRIIADVNLKLEHSVSTPMDIQVLDASIYDEILQTFNKIPLFAYADLLDFGEYRKDGNVYINVKVGFFFKSVITTNMADQIAKIVAAAHEYNDGSFGSFDVAFIGPVALYQMDLEDQVYNVYDWCPIIGSKVCQDGEICQKKDLFIECLPNPESEQRDFLPWGEQYGDSLVMTDDLEADNIYENWMKISDKIVFHEPVPLGKQPFKFAHVLTNGAITFGTRTRAWWPNMDYAYGLGKTLLAPYWSQFNPMPGQKVNHQLYEKNFEAPGQNANQKAQVLAQASQEVNEYNEDAANSFKATVVLVATWDEIEPFNWYTWYCTYGKDNQDEWIQRIVADYCQNLQKETATFQGVFISDGFKSYALVTFLRGAQKWNFVEHRPIAAVGHVTTFGVKDLGVTNSPIATKLDTLIGNKKRYGTWMDFVGQMENPVSECNLFLEKNKQLLNNVTFQQNVQDMLQCPCSLSQMPPQWWGVDWNEDLEDGKTIVQCFALSPMAKRTPRLQDNYLNNLCCYRYTIPFGGANWNDVMRNSTYLGHRDQEGSHIITGSPWWWNERYRAYRNNDVAPRRSCCTYGGVASCEKYNLVRPDIGCTSEVQFLEGMALGDPHIITVDNNQYTFNGVGEYTLTEVKSVNFMFQGRAVQTLLSNGKKSDATVFVAFAVQDGPDTHIQVELNAEGTGMNILWKKQFDITGDFNDKEDYRMSIGDFQVSRANNRSQPSLVVSYTNGISVSFNVGMKINLEFSIKVNKAHLGQCKGLLGNCNGDKNDDFVIPTGDILPTSQTDTGEKIFHNFGQRWLVEEGSTIFNYNAGQGPSTFINTSHVPFFIENAPSSDINQATSICGGDDSACIYDYLVLRDENFAIHSKNSNEEAEAIQVVIANRIPSVSVDSSNLNGDSRWLVYDGESSTMQFSASDPDNDAVTFELAYDVPGVTIDSANGQLTFVPNIESPLRIGVRASDAKGGISQIHDLSVIVCTRCNSSGMCDPTDFRAERKSGFFLLASCICNLGYSGDNCEEDFDACEDTPCSEGQQCFDLTPAEQQINPRGFQCSPCLDGYSNLGGVCADINECLNTTHPVCKSEATCENTEGSYTCTCNTGYTLREGDDDCDDVDECSTRTHQCEQVCVNTDGSYNCTCESGYLLDPDGRTCYLENQYSALCGASNCDQLCVVKDGVASCSCRAGFSVDPANETMCIDVDECTSGKSCSQKCDNTVGSFSCSCNIGYILEDDNVTCSKCKDDNYGEKCEGLCVCNRRGTCDHVKGCECTEGWTGEHCTVNVNECEEPGKCPSNRDCQDTQGSYECVCPSGFEENDDEECIDLDECKDTRTHNCDLLFEECVNTPGSFGCRCSQGYAKNADGVCVDIDECQTGGHDCEQLCLNLDGGFTCSCRAGFVLNSDRKTCSDERETDPCADAGLSCDTDCAVDADTNEVSCFCNIGYTLVGTGSCVDINECTIDRLNLCEEKEKCINTDGAYACSCKPGFQLDRDERSCVECEPGKWGVNCTSDCSCSNDGAARCDTVKGCICNSGYRGDDCDEDIDECATGVTSCLEGQECVNERGGAHCECLEGYEENATGFCIDKDECSDPGTCPHDCVNTPGGYTCECFSGYIFNATSEECDDIDECDLKTSGCEVDCDNTKGGFKCSCPDGLRLSPDGVNCIVMEECSSKSCEDRCAVVESVETCFCPRGEKVDPGNDELCQDVDLCADASCSDTCEETGDGTSFHCTCPDGKKLSSNGIDCEECPDGKYGKGCIETCACIGVNTESCDKEDGSCECRDGFNGTLCASDIDECADGASCQLNSECENTLGSYVCKCAAGYYNDNEVCTECAANRYGLECNGTCLCDLSISTCDSVSGTCNCDAGLTGTLCETDIDECADPSNTCAVMNMAHVICVNKEGSYDCECDTGYIDNGSFNCTDVDECNSAVTNLCSDKCTNTEGSFTCSCNSGYQLASGSLYQCEDTNECTTNTDNCSQVCTNTAGGFSCSCEAGYRMDPNDGTLCYLSNAISFFLTIAYDISSYDLNDLAQYQYLYDIFYSLLLDTLQTKVGGIKEFVFTLSQGSVIIDATTYIDANIETSSASSMVEALILIAEQGVVVNGTTVSATVLVNGTTVTSTTSKCVVLELIEPCASGTYCNLDSTGKAYCTSGDSDDDDDLPLIIGLAIGLPALAIIFGLIIAILYFKSKGHSSHRKVSSSQGYFDDNGSRPQTADDYGSRPQSTSSTLSGPKLAFFSSSSSLGGSKSKLADPLAPIENAAFNP